MLVLDIKATNEGKTLVPVGRVTIRNLGNHPEAPARANYEAIFFVGNQIEVARASVEGFNRALGAFPLIREVFKAASPTLKDCSEARHIHEYIKFVEASEGNEICLQDRA